MRTSRLSLCTQIRLATPCTNDVLNTARDFQRFHTIFKAVELGKFPTSTSNDKSVLEDIYRQRKIDNALA
jgi:hypothetical protein